MKASRPARSGGKTIATALWWLCKATMHLLWRISKPISLWLGARCHRLHKSYPGEFYSFLLHVFLLVLLTFNFSWFMPEPKIMDAITVELLPVADKANIKPEPTKKPMQPEKKKVKKPERPKPPLPPKVEPQRPEPEPITPPTPKPKPEQPKKEPLKKPAPVPEKKEEKKPEPPAPLLKTLEKQKADDTPSPQKLQTNTPEYQPELPLSITDIQAIQSQLYHCWNVPAGARGVEDMTIEVHISLQQDGTVQSATLTDRSRYASDAFYRAAADSAIRAVQACSPLKGLPANKYNQWKEIEFVFDPSGMIY